MALITTPVSSIAGPSVLITVGSQLSYLIKGMWLNLPVQLSTSSVPEPEPSLPPFWS